MIEIQNYDLVVKNKMIINDINLTINAEDTVLITGANGSGKSLLLRAINSGNKGVSNSFEKTGVVIEKSKLLPHMTGREFLYFLNKLEGINVEQYNKQADQLIEYFELDKYQDKKISTYSLGTTHKFALIQAFMHNPSLILLDEPYDSLDKKAIELLTTLINERRKNNVTFMIVAHDEEKILKMINFNKWIEIDNGELTINDINN